MAISKKVARTAEGKFTKIARAFSRNRHIQVRLSGTGCYTDSKKLINLPANSDFLSDDTQHLLEGMLDHEAGHCHREQTAVERRLAGDKTFPLPSEVMAKYKTTKERNLINMFEDISLEAEASRTYVGIAQNLADMNEVLLAQLAKKAAMGELSAWASLTCGIISRTRGTREDFLVPGVSSILDKLEAVIARAKVHTATVADSERRMKETLAIIADFAEPEAGDEGDSKDSEPSEEPAEKGEKTTKAARSATPEPEAKEESKPEEDDTSDGTADKLADEDEGEGKTDEPKEGAEDSADEEHGPGSSDEEEDVEGSPESSGEGEEEGGEGESATPEPEAKEESKPEEDDTSDGTADKLADEGSEEPEAGDEGDSKGSEPSEEPAEGTGDSAPEADAGEEAAEPEAHDDLKPSEGDSAEGELDSTRAFARELEETDSDTEHGLEEELEKLISGESKRDMSVHERHYPHPEVLKYDRVIVAPKGTDEEYRKEAALVAPVVSGLRSRLMLYLRSMKAVRLTGDKEHGSIDIAALYSLRTGNKRIFAERTKAPETNTVIGVLVDQSGSMNGAKIETARRSTIALGECLSKLNIPFAIWGFDNDNNAAPGTGSYGGWRRGEAGRVADDGVRYNRTNPMYIRVFKGLGETFVKTRNRLASMASGSQNVDGEAVQWCVDQLRACPEPRKILLVLSDGQPCCGGTDSRLSGDHIRYVASVATSVGVEVFGLGILTDCVKEFYTDWGEVRSLQDLPKVLFEVLRKYLFKSPSKKAR